MRNTEKRESGDPQPPTTHYTGPRAALLRARLRSLAPVDRGGGVVCGWWLVVI